MAGSGIEARCIGGGGAQNVGNSVWTSAAQAVTPTTCVTDPRILRFLRTVRRACFCFRSVVGSRQMLSDLGHRCTGSDYIIILTQAVNRLLTPIVEHWRRKSRRTVAVFRRSEGRRRSLLKPLGGLERNHYVLRTAIPCGSPRTGSGSRVAVRVALAA
jgi:hypothetical protein